MSFLRFLLQFYPNAFCLHCVLIGGSSYFVSAELGCLTEKVIKLGDLKFSR